MTETSIVVDGPSGGGGGRRGLQHNQMAQLSGLLEWADEEAARNPLCASLALACVGSESEDSIVVQKTLPMFNAGKNGKPEEREQFFAQRSALVAAMVDTFYSTAQGEVEESPRSQTYMLVAYGKGKNDFIGRRKFTMHPPIGKMMNAESEPATEKGLVAQAMRWGDTTLRHGSGNLQVVIDLLQSELQRKEMDLQSMRAYNKQLEDRRLEEFKITEDLRSKALERELALKREARQDERLERLWRQLEGYVPVLVAKYSGTSIAALAAPTPSAPDATPIDRFAKFFFGLAPEQKKGMLDQLSEAQQGEFMGILKALVEMNERDKAQKAASSAEKAA